MEKYAVKVHTTQDVTYVYTTEADSIIKAKEKINFLFKIEKPNVKIDKIKAWVEA